MSSPVLTKLTIAHLRGSVELFELPFEKHKNLTIIYGENGTGKSTICDALELLSTGRVGSLDNRGLGKTNQYWTSVSKDPADVSVTLHTSSGTCQAKIVKGNVVVQPAADRPRVEVLRRSQILALIEARPGERYAAISRFIDVSGIEDGENTLRKLIADLNSTRNVAAAGILENRTSIDQFWQTAGKPGANAFTWAEAEVARPPQATSDEVVALRKLQAAYARLTDYPTRFRDAQQMLQQARAAAVAAQQQTDQTLNQIAGDAGEIMKLLEAAQTFLSKQSAAAICPLCEQTNTSGNLAERVAQRLTAFAALQQAQTRQQADTSQLQRAEQHVELLQAQVRADAMTFEQARAEFVWPPNIRLPAAPAPQDDTLADWLAANADLPTHWNQAETMRHDKGQFLAALKLALETYAENMQGQQELDILLPNLKRALTIIEAERKAFTDDILSKIANEVGRMYELVHPGEGLNKIKLELDAVKRASLDIGTTFGGLSAAPPQAYFSQSHLDTLGLCVFLAMANLDDPQNTILILDDVLASVDAPHVDRLIEMLYGEATKFRHCIITTHYGPWRHKMRWGWLKNGQCQFVELSRWSKTDGISVIRSVPEIERLRALLDEPAPDPQLVCAKAGVILEAALDFLTQLYECSVPRKQEPRYTLGELLPAIKKELRKALRVERQTGHDALGVPTYTNIELAPLLNELERIAQTRNVIGCHFNAISFELLDADALVFGTKVLELIEALTDPAAGWPGKDKSGSYWANAGETRRLHPLRRPS